MSFDDIGVELPQQSILTEEEYRQIYSVATNTSVMNVLEYIDSEERVWVTNIDDPEPYYTLHDAGLVTQRMQRDGFHSEMYYVVNQVGEVLLENSAEEGVAELMQRESEFAEVYSSEE